MKKKILVCGHFNNWNNSYDGQTIKTINIYNELIKKYGKDNVLISDTYFIKKKPLLFLIKLIKSIKKCNNVIILPAQRGIKVIIPLLNILNFKNTFKIHYVVIGGWIYDLIKDCKWLINQINKINYIYVETPNTIFSLKKLGLNNIYQMNNFKNLIITQKKYKKRDENFKCCIFSRIEYLKGIGDAIDAIEGINRISDKKVFLDIYGKIKNEYENEFYSKINESQYIKYKGIINSNESVTTIENYDLLLFPTLYYTEGIPGTIIDSYFAGVPVLSSKWENFDDVIDENETGISYKFKNVEDLKNKLQLILDNHYNLEYMSKRCKIKAHQYLPDISLKILFENIEKGD